MKAKMAQGGGSSSESNTSADDELRTETNTHTNVNQTITKGLRSLKEDKKASAKPVAGVADVNPIVEEHSVAFQVESPVLRKEEAQNRGEPKPKFACNMKAHYGGMAAALKNMPP